MLGCNWLDVMQECECLITNKTNAVKDFSLDVLYFSITVDKKADIDHCPLKVAF